MSSQSIQFESQCGKNTYIKHPMQDKLFEEDVSAMWFLKHLPAYDHNSLTFEKRLHLLS